MFQAIASAGRQIARLFTKSSSGQNKLLAMLNNNSSLVVGNLWSSNRSELASKWTGWDYVAGDAIASEFAGMKVHYAYKRQEDGEYSNPKRKCLNRAQRQKALTGLQANVDLEPVSHEHPLMRLEARPNPYDRSYTYWYKAAAFYEHFGECYLWDVPNEVGLPVVSWVLPAHWMWPVSGNGNLIDRWEVRPISPNTQREANFHNWGWFGGTGSKFDVPGDQIIRIYKPGLTSLFGAQAAASACATWKDCSDNMDSSRVFKFQNDAFPSCAIVFDKDMQMEDFTQERIDSMKLAFKQKYAGVIRTGEPVVLGPGASLQILSSSPRDMDYHDGFAQMRDSTMAAHRTGPMVVGMANETTHAAGKAARAGWHVSKITPMAVDFGQAITEGRARKFDEDLICFRMDSKPEDVEFEQTQRKDFLAMDVITINEARAQVGLPPMSGPNEEIGDMTVSAVKAHFAVPKGLGMEGDGLLPAPDDGNRISGLLAPSTNGHGNGSLLGGDKTKALTDLSRRFLMPNLVKAVLSEPDPELTSRELEELLEGVLDEA